MSDEQAPSSPLLRLVELGAATQVLVPGLYAWAITVAPAGFGHGSSWYGGLFALVALLALPGGLVLERVQQRTHAVHPVVVWVFALASAATWASNTDALTPTRLGLARGLAGTVGWALFALACAAPPVAPAADARVETGLRARGTLARGDAGFVGAGALLALALQGIGWDVDVPERATLVRLVTLACGIALVSAASAVALARHGRRASVAGRLRFRWLVLLALLLAAGVFWRLLA